MKTNDMKYGTRILLACGWQATLKDNAKGATRVAEVEGFYTEIGSVYTHDIVAFWDKDRWNKDIEYPESALKTKKLLRDEGWL